MVATSCVFCNQIHRNYKAKRVPNINIFNEMNKKKIKEVLGGHYSPAIIKHLNKKGLIPFGGGEYTPQIIQNIVDGRTIDLDAMQEINLLVVATEKKKNKILKKLN